MHVRSMLNMPSVELHLSIKNGRITLLGTFKVNELWKDVWVSFRLDKHNALLWQILYLCIVTNKWRFDILHDFHQAKKCTIG